MHAKIRPLETRYRGYRFRSRLEARWAVFFEACRQRYVYEHEGFRLPSGPYLPDFFFPLRRAFVEIKPLIQLPTRCFEFGYDRKNGLPIDDCFPREIIQAIELSRFLDVPEDHVVVLYGDPVDVIEGDGGAISVDRNGPRVGIGFIDLFPARLFESANRARGAQFEHGACG